LRDKKAVINGKTKQKKTERKGAVPKPSYDALFEKSKVKKVGID
jgi:hypothetical protein